MQKRIGFLLGPLRVFFFYFLSVLLKDYLRKGKPFWRQLFGSRSGGLPKRFPLRRRHSYPLCFFPLSGGMELSTTTAAFGHRFVFLYLGGFLIAIGIEKWNLHKRIAINIISFIGSDVRYVILGFMVATAFLSMWDFKHSHFGDDAPHWDCHY